MSRYHVSCLSPDGSPHLLRERRGVLCLTGVVPREAMTSNGLGSEYRSSDFAVAALAMSVSCVLSRPYDPWQKGRVERMYRDDRM